MAKIDYLSKAKEYAKSRGGECLATEYNNKSEKLEWKCNNPDHPSWIRSMEIINKNSWCPKCAKDVIGGKKRLEDGLQQAHGLALKNGGTCISTEYVNNSTKMLWKCNNSSHEPFYSVFNDTKKGRWCKKCANEKSRLKMTLKDGLQQAHSLALKNGGACLSTEYVNNSTKMLWKCNNSNHSIWKTTFNHIKKGSWCPECVKLSEEQVLEKCRIKAKLMSGLFLSTAYQNRQSKLKFQCNAGHPAFETTYDNVINHDTWCPRCAGMFTPEEFLQKAQEKAISKGGLCLSKKYINADNKLIWKCSHPEHNAWKSTYSSVVNGDRWCKVCSNFIHYKENKFRNLFEYLFDTEFPNTKPKWNINFKTNRLLQLDGYSESLKLAFEFQGLQHYQVVKYFKMDEEILKYLQFKDKVKKENCIKNGVKLIIIDDNNNCSNNQNLFNYLMELLSKNNILITKKIDMIEVNKILNKMTNFQENALSNANNYAKSKNGYCLSKTYINTNEKLEWKCHNPNHPSWFRSMSLISSKNWCPYCRKN